MGTERYFFTFAARKNQRKLVFHKIGILILQSTLHGQLGRIGPNGRIFAIMLVARGADNALDVLLKGNQKLLSMVGREIVTEIRPRVNLNLRLTAVVNYKH